LSLYSPYAQKKRRADLCDLKSDRRDARFIKALFPALGKGLSLPIHYPKEECLLLFFLSAGKEKIFLNSLT
jgi:hypothetical protein